MYLYLCSLFKSYSYFKLDGNEHRREDCYLICDSQNFKRI